MRKILELEDRLARGVERIAVLEQQLDALRKEHRRELVPVRRTASGTRSRSF